MFATFPEFSVLRTEDKEAYNQLVSGYPPYSDIAFSTLHIWWNLHDNLKLATHNNNLVIEYHLPFDAANSGLGVIGTNNVDETISAIFDYQTSGGLEPKLLHVPEFTIEALADKSQYSIEEEPDYHEYVMDSHALATLESPELGRIRRKVSRFLRDTEDMQVVVRELDLQDQAMRDSLLAAMTKWQAEHPNNNDPENTELASIQRTLTYSEILETKGYGLYVDDVLDGFVLFHVSIDGQYFILNHLKVNYHLPFIFDYMTQMVAQKAVAAGAAYLNMEMDLGIEGLRRHKMGLRPVNFFKKYTVTKL